MRGPLFLLCYIKRAMVTFHRVILRQVTWRWLAAGTSSSMEQRFSDNGLEMFSLAVRRKLPKEFITSPAEFQKSFFSGIS